MPLLKYLTSALLGILVLPYLGCSTLCLVLCSLLLTLSSILLARFIRKYPKLRIHRLISVALVLVFMLLSAAVKQLQGGNARRYDKEMEAATGFAGRVLSVTQSKRSQRIVLLVDVAVDQTRKKVKVKALVYVPLNVPVQEHQRLYVRGKAQRIKNKEGQRFDYQAFMKQQEIYWMLWPRRGKLAIRCGRKATVPLATNVISGVRKKAIAKLHRVGLPADSEAFCRALMFGEKKALSTELQHDVRIVGLSHILAVSGLHVGMVFAVLAWLLKLQRGMLGVRAVKFVVVLLTLYLYAGLAAFTPSVLRAGLMFSLLALGQVVGRKGVSLNALCLAALLLLWINPWVVHAVGFQLSFAAVAGILIFQEKMAALLTGATGIKGGVIDLVSVGFAAQLLTTPLVLYYFGEWPTYGMITTLLVLPFLPVVLLGAVLLIVLPDIQMAERVVLWVETSHIQYILWVIKNVVQWPAARVEVPTVYWQEVVAMYGGMLLLYGVYNKWPIRWVGVYSMLITLLIFSTSKKREKDRRCISSVLNEGKFRTMVVPKREVVELWVTEAVYQRRDFGQEVGEWVSGHEGKRVVVHVLELERRRMSREAKNWQ